MKFSTEVRDKVAIVTSHVEKLDALHAPELKAELVRLSKEGIYFMVLDRSESRYCDSSGLSAVLIGNRVCRDAGGAFVLSGLQPTVVKLVKISQLDRVLNIVPTVSEGYDYAVMEYTQRSLGSATQPVD